MSLLLLQALSISFNPIGDAGLYYILRATMNVRRKARESVPRPLELFNADADGVDDLDSDGEESQVRNS
tara:strand:+ start:197 stop:403 length:207 start_codon:yes stop_codon:yes gene_type:complete